MADAGRDPAGLEMVGGVRGDFPAPDAVAELGPAMDALPALRERGFTTFCIKPSMFINHMSELPAFCRKAMRLADELTEPKR